MKCVELWVRFWVTGASKETTLIDTVGVLQAYLKCEIVLSCRIVHQLLTYHIFTSSHYYRTVSILQGLFERWNDASQNCAADPDLRQLTNNSEIQV